MLIDELSNNEYHLGGDNDKLKNANTRTIFFCVMVCEKLVNSSLTHQSSSLIHFLCTYPSLQGRGYIKRIMKVVFDQDDMMYTQIHAVTRLPCGYKPTEIS